MKPGSKYMTDVRHFLCFQMMKFEVKNTDLSNVYGRIYCKNCDFEQDDIGVSKEYLKRKFKRI